MNEDKILKKLIEHDGRFDTHDKRFDAHDKRFDAHDKRFDAHDKRFDAHDKRFDALAAKLIDHDQRFDSLEGEFRGFKQQVLTAQDEMITILRRLDEERIFTTAWVQRIEKEVEEHRAEIARIKAQLKIG